MPKIFEVDVTKPFFRGEELSFIKLVSATPARIGWVGGLTVYPFFEIPCGFTTTKLTASDFGRKAVMYSMKFVTPDEWVTSYICAPEDAVEVFGEAFKPWIQPHAHQ